jgi:ArsR family metal-binding transcriptional regulator
MGGRHIPAWPHPGAVFGYLIQQWGTAAYAPEITVDVAACDRCFECREFNSCRQLSAARILLEEEQRLITLYPRKVMIGKAEELVDGWRAIESLRTLVNCVWARRASISPSHKARSKPPVLELYRLLPQIDCKACGEATCMAFAARLWKGTAAS